ncbi:LSU ribosomal protein L31p [Crocosphaera watsonii WH 0402]|uniref:Large ribosomal subunit protein bL31 n=1 Tax=Crocosphaera watsonii WH 0402 TaxID=1284629 RepID=T2JXN7_CROWT|nr:LSU ribosomal protein L31p [Crocosphaera watsonii WH 0402]
MAKAEIHPTWYPEAKVICNGEVVLTVGSTQPEIHVEVWSGNHPFYTGTQKIIDTEGRVDRFQKRYAMIGKKSKKKQPKQMLPKNSEQSQIYDPAEFLLGCCLLVNIE